MEIIILNKNTVWYPQKLLNTANYGKWEVFITNNRELALKDSKILMSKLKYCLAFKLEKNRICFYYDCGSYISDGKIIITALKCYTKYSDISYKKNGKKIDCVLPEYDWLGIFSDED